MTRPAAIALAVELREDSRVAVERSVLACELSLWAGEPETLSERQMVAGRRRESGLDDALHLRMRREPRGDCAAVRVVRAHPDGKRLDAARHEEGVERREDSSRSVLGKPDSLAVLGVLADDRTADRIG